MERMVDRAAWGWHDFVLKSGVLAERGKLACIDTADGSITKGALSATLIPLGLFTETLTGDGVKTVQVRMFHELSLFWWNNDTAGTPLTAASVGKLAYIKDDQTVSAVSVGASAAGLVLQVDALKGVLVYSSYPFTL